MADPSDHESPQLQRFLSTFWKDVDAGSPRPLADYLAQFPGEDAAIAHEYAEVLRAVDSKRAAPESIGQYRIFRELGRGGQGAVYLAEDSRLGRKVALKILSGVPALSPRAVQRFRREAEITAQIDHPGICTTYDFGNQDGMPWIAMRYVEGETLAAKIAAAQSPDGSLGTSGHLSFSREALATPGSDREDRPPTSHSTSRTREEIAWVVRVIEQAARALHVAHEHGVIHRDIKPANIMVTADDTPVILDFGLANVAEGTGPDLTMTGELMGTPHYIAPEQLTRTSIQLDRRADVYSLGVTLYEALTLSRPFDSPTRDRLYQAILAKDPTDPHRVNPAISRDLSAVVATAIEKDRDRRYRTALDFADDLKRVLDRVPVLARRLGLLPRLVRWVQRNPLVASSVMSAFAILAGALAVTVTLLKRTEDALAEKARLVTGFERLSDLKRLRDLSAAADDLLAPLPSNLEVMRGWLKRAEALVSQLPVHEADLGSLGGPAKPDPATQTRTEDLWKHEYLSELVRDLRAFADPDPHHGLIADVRHRLERAQTIRKRSIADFEDRWKATIASISDVARSPSYRGLRIAPQIGLVPIGKNSTSGLWEFAVLDSGSLPETDGQDGSFEFEEGAALILVLLPGGSFRMGSPPDEVERGDDESLHEVEVAPFFVGKHEVTQAQWREITGSNPSNIADTRITSTPAHPVEHVDWYQSVNFARRLNLTLPTETQWEYACRAGTSTMFAFGSGAGSLEGHANVGDASLEDLEGGRFQLVVRAPWNDGFPYHAPVQALAANAFGLFGFHGNVGEWCLDWYRPDPDADPGIVAHKGPEARMPPHKVWRDGSWLTGPLNARAAARHHLPPGSLAPAIGLRVARALDLTQP